MDIIKKIDILVDTTIVGDVEQNTAQGHIDVIGGKCPEGYIYNKKKKVCVSKIKESSIIGGSYINSTTVNIIGSQQTRTGFTTKRDIVDLARKEKIENEYDDSTETNILGRKGLKFDKKSGAYIPNFWMED